MSEERPRHQRIKNIGNYLLQTVKKTGFWLCLIIIAMAGYIAYQQAQIDELATQVYGQHNMSDSDSFDYRITNLEHISNAHAARLKETEKDIWILRKEIDNLQWRLMQLEWIHPEITVPQAEPTKPSLKDFNSNLGNVPFPLKPDESIMSNETP